MSKANAEIWYELPHRWAFTMNREAKRSSHDIFINIVMCGFRRAVLMIKGLKSMKISTLEPTTALKTLWPRLSAILVQPERNSGKASSTPNSKPAYRDEARICWPRSETSRSAIDGAKIDDARSKAEIIAARKASSFSIVIGHGRYRRFVRKRQRNVATTVKLC